jgi:hypothetical protein
MARDERPRPEAAVIGYGDVSERVQHLVSHARDNNLWIFDKTFKRWYSPEEYVERFNYYPQDAEEMLKRCEAKDPLAAIGTGHQKLSLLMDRVFKYMGSKKQQ